MIRETSSRRNRPLCHRGSNNDSDHGCKISTLPQPLSLRRQEPLQAAARAFHSAFHHLVQGREAAPAAPGAALRRSSGLSSVKLTLSKNVNQLTIDIIRYILSQF